MSGRKNWNIQCPICGESVRYWPNCSETTSVDYWDAEWTVTKRGTRQFFHRSCYMSQTRKNHLPL